jgi:peptide/nickel transport system permease protein
MTRVGVGILALVATLAAAAPVLAPNDPATPFVNRAYAPPTRIHLRDLDGWHAPFIYRQVLADRVLRRYVDDTSTRVPLQWWRDGRLFGDGTDSGPMLVLGADPLGRDIFSRLLFGARLSLGVTALGAAGALMIGAVVGALAGVAGGWLEAVLMWIADFMLVLPAVYLLLVLRAVMPLSLGWTTIFALMAVLFAAAGWPQVARGVRGIVATERTRDYAQAARAIGAGPFRLVGHLLPAASGFLAVELVLLVPAMLVAEATLSYLGLGFPPERPSWGTMLQDTANVRLLADAPWLLAPAALLFIVVLGLQLVLGARSERTLLKAASRS